MQLISIEKVSLETEETEMWNKFYAMIEAIYERTTDYHVSDIAHRIMMDMDELSMFIDEE